MPLFQKNQTGIDFFLNLKLRLYYYYYVTILYHYFKITKIYQKCARPSNLAQAVMLIYYRRVQHKND